MMENRKRRIFKKENLAFGMIRILILCLVVPFFTLSIVLFYFSKTKTESRIDDAVKTTMENVAENCEISINDAVQESKKASYDGEIKSAYLKFLQDRDETEMYKTVSGYLNKTYKYSHLISSTILLFVRETKMEYYTYSNVAGATYASVNDFKEYAMEPIRKEAENLGTGTKLIMAGNHLYLIRNIVRDDYTPFATLAMEINVHNMFKSIDNIVWSENGLIYLNGKLIRKSDESSSESLKQLDNFIKENDVLKDNYYDYEYIYDNKSECAYLKTKKDNHNITYVLKLDSVAILKENNTIEYIYLIIVVLTFVLVFFTIRYFYTNINRPIADLVRASGKIEEGEYGIELPQFDANKEFSRLFETFNHMSTSLRDSFNRIYTEEVALRDANIQALQLQINPHFLNNTLEIINWKARMSGNTDVSEMIESLGIMMEATMNREKKEFITLTEEMRYVDAYLYIIRQRFGSKFIFEKQIDEKLMNVKIPRLIIQPLVENMVEHGGDKYGNRTGKLKVFIDDKFLHILVENNGNLSEEDKNRIDTLLNSPQLEENMHNIGIRNVNLRLKLTYGENSGLTITNPTNQFTMSEIRISLSSLEDNKEQ